MQQVTHFANKNIDFAVPKWNPTGTFSLDLCLDHLTSLIYLGLVRHLTFGYLSLCLD